MKLGHEKSRIKLKPAMLLTLRALIGRNGLHDLPRRLAITRFYTPVRKQKVQILVFLQSFTSSIHRLYLNIQKPTTIHPILVWLYRCDCIKVAAVVVVNPSFLSCLVVLLYIAGSLSMSNQSHLGGGKSNRPKLAALKRVCLSPFVLSTFPQQTTVCNCLHRDRFDCVCFLVALLLFSQLEANHRSSRKES